jgi:hypothetical protein
MKKLRIAMNRRSALNNKTLEMEMRGVRKAQFFINGNCTRKTEAKKNRGNRL